MKDKANANEVRRLWNDSSSSKPFTTGAPMSNGKSVESFCIAFVYQKHLQK
jgi:hypothetical protein